MAKKMPPIEQLRGRPLGRVLIKMGKITRDKVHKALSVQKESATAVPLGQVLLDLGYITDKDLNLGLAFQLGMVYMDLANVDIADNIIGMITAQMAMTYRVLPVEYEESSNTLTIAMDTASNFRATDDLRTLLGFKIQAMITDTEQLEQALGRYYSGKAESIGDLIGELSEDEFLAEFKDRGESIDLNELRELADSNPVKRLLNLVLLQAIRDKASDIHFEPFESEFKMRYRIDGVLYEMIPPPRHIAVALSSRLKVMANLDIAERRMPQDGRIPLVVQSRPVDLRVSVLPTMFGESVVLRVLDRMQVQLDLDRLGMLPDEISTFRRLIGKPNGIVIVTGPTGSGKTTTLYSALSELNTIDSKLITTEDPVEYDIDGIIQVQIRAEIGLTFSRCLRSILRQDPDIILVGEIRDLETAQIAVQASLTGHLVFSTLHTNDAPSSVARLLDLGLEPFLITATMEGIVGQRLVRKVCNNCRTAFQPTEEALMELELTPEQVAGKQFYYGKGCDYCNNTGYKGRMGLYEIMELDDDLREAIMQRASTNILREKALKKGMSALRESGISAIFEGLTTLEEVVKETVLEEG
ncbi:MAG: Flp pilus assembly complex ATPase component TadA [Sedimentisphaerales bacterium]|nr:Flp pilus assembly complex ATPase component TadA [Sedimentisphaerales bacterium]